MSELDTAKNNSPTKNQLTGVFDYWCKLSFHPNDDPGGVCYKFNERGKWLQVEKGYVKRP